jgi:RNA polymerase sigma-70 factor, ECF subfamily
MLERQPAVRVEPPALEGKAVPDSPVFADVYAAHFAFVWRTVRRLGAPDASVEDLTQEIFVIVHRRLDEFEGRSSLRGWLFAIVANVVRGHRRALQKKNPHMLSGPATPDPETLTAASGTRPDELATKAEASRLVRAFLDELDEEKREIFVLAELEQMSAPEIAAAIGVPVNTVYSRLRLARQAFAAAGARHRARQERRST